MNLANLMDVLGAGVWVTVATEKGQQWIIYDRVMMIEGTPEYEKLKFRKVTNVYDREGREGNNRCCALQPGIGIIVEGDENGTF